MEKPICRLIGKNGNIFNLISIACNTLRKNDMHDEAKELQERVLGGEAKSYDEALRIIMEYVEVE